MICEQRERKGEGKGEEGERGKEMTGGGKGGVWGKRVWA